MRVLVTGASGFIGGELCRTLLARGHAVRAVVRRPPRESPGSATREFLVRDFSADIDWNSLVDGFDAIVHLAAIGHRGANAIDLRRVNVDATAKLASAAAGRVRRFVFLSSVKVHGEDSNEGAFTETAPFRPEDAYARSKADAELSLIEIAGRSGMEVALIRPPLVYGASVKGNVLRLLRWIDSGLPLPLASVSNRRTLIGVGSLADSVARCVERAGAQGAFLVGDDESVSTPELIAKLARALGKPARLMRAPVPLLRSAACVVGRRSEIRSLTRNLIVDASRARRLLEWRPLRTLDDGLAETARWYLRRQSARGTG